MLVYPSNMNRLVSLQDAPSEAEARTVSPEIAPETQHPMVLDRPPEPEIKPAVPPTRKTSWILAIIAAIVTVIGLASWFQPDMEALFNQFLPYSSATAFMVIGL